MTSSQYLHAVKFGMQFDKQNFKFYSGKNQQVSVFKIFLHFLDLHWPVFNVQCYLYKELIALDWHRKLSCNVATHSNINEAKSDFGQKEGTSKQSL